MTELDRLYKDVITIISAQIKQDILLGYYDNSTPYKYEFMAKSFLGFCTVEYNMVRPDILGWIDKNTDKLLKKYKKYDTINDYVIAAEIMKTAMTIAKVFVDSDLQKFGTLSKAEYYVDLVISYTQSYNCTYILRDELEKKVQKYIVGVSR